MDSPNLRKKFVIFLAVALTVTLLLILFPFVETFLKDYIEKFFGASDPKMSGTAVNLFDNLFSILKIVLWMTLVIAIVRFLNALVSNTLLRSGQHEISNLVRNVVSIIIFIAAFFVILQSQYSTAYEKLTPIFTGSTIIAVVLGFALQDTLGNLFAGLAIQADQPFQIGDVVKINNKGAGVVENISWRGVKIRTFQNKLLVISNSVLGKEAIEVAPRDNLNARLVDFNTLYANSPAQTIKIIRDVVRQAENVSQKLRPIVRIKKLGDSGIDWEVKYWLEDYSKFNETDALVRQRIWYVFQREKIEFYYPTRTIHIETKPQENVFEETGDEIFERLSEVSIFAPLSDDETRKLAEAGKVIVYAPGEAIVRQGQKGHSMFVVHRGTVKTQIMEDGKTRILDTLREGDFFGEMGLLTGAPRSATAVAEDETEVLEIDNTCLKPILEANPELVSSFSQLVEERRDLINRLQTEALPEQKVDKAGIFHSIRNFFGMND
ncbi:MAG TPA: mechanosensitive ion channel family protein [Pyrinomonadaceae bacterium]|nr:mechanosensitive ion channel family protein [Pyrinomonadaceae bacterium]